VLLVDFERGDALGELLPGLLDRDEALRFAVGERLEQHAVDDRENGCAGADGQGQCHDHRRRVGAVAPQASQDVAQIERELSHMATN
jgi:hypothetical protein